MFASSSLSVHVARGLVGFGLLGLAFTSQHVGVMLVLFLAGLLALRGCPMCWTMGLVETISNTLRTRRGQSAVSICATCHDSQRS